jgi:hypothetical protein
MLSVAILLTPDRVAIIKKISNNKCWQGWRGFRQEETLNTVGENVNYVVTMEISKKFLQKTENKTTA